MFGRTAWKWSWLLSLALSTTLLAAAKDVSFSPAAGSVEAYDFLEVTVNVAEPDARNPFTDVTLRGSFAKAGAIERSNVEGFCDSPDGSVFRIRFMPPSPGDYTYSVAYRQVTSRRPLRARSGPPMATGEVLSALMLSTLGTLYGRAPESTISSTAPRRIGCPAGARSGPSTTASSAFTGSR